MTPGVKTAQGAGMCRWMAPGVRKASARAYQAYARRVVPGVRKASARAYQEYARRIGVGACLGLVPTPAATHM